MSRAFRDLTGQRFGKLMAMRKDGISDRGYANWVCRCDCGKTVIVDSRSLTKEQKKDCGCSSFRNMDVCIYNYGVTCSGTGCETCGWNPEIARRRKEKKENAV